MNKTLTSILLGSALAAGCSTEPTPEHDAPSQEETVQVGDSISLGMSHQVFSHHAPDTLSLRGISVNNRNSIQSRDSDRQILQYDSQLSQADIAQLASQGVEIQSSFGAGTFAHLAHYTSADANPHLDNNDLLKAVNLTPRLKLDPQLEASFARPDEMPWSYAGESQIIVQFADDIQFDQALDMIQDQHGTYVSNFEINHGGRTKVTSGGRGDVMPGANIYTILVDNATLAQTVTDFTYNGDVLSVSHGTIPFTHTNARALRVTGIKAAQDANPQLTGAWDATNNVSDGQYWTDLQDAVEYPGADGAAFTDTMAHMRVLVYDGGTMDPTLDTEGRMAILDDDFYSSHATHVGGSVGANGAGTLEFLEPLCEPGNYQFSLRLECIDAEVNGTPDQERMAEFGRGGMPESILLSAGYDSCDPHCLYDNPQDILIQHEKAVTLFGAHLSTQSIGSNATYNGYPCEFNGDFNEWTSRLLNMEAMGVFGYRATPSFFAAGNENGGPTCKTSFGDKPHQLGYDQIGAPAAGLKNGIVVGAAGFCHDVLSDQPGQSVDLDDLENQMLCPSSYTSWGPVDDGGLGVFLMTFGGDFDHPTDRMMFSQTSGDDQGNVFYGLKAGTSMATPWAASGSGVVMQAGYMDDRPEVAENIDLLKAILAVSTDLPTNQYQTGKKRYGEPNPVTGHGMLNVEKAIEVVEAGQYYQGDVEHGEQIHLAVYFPEPEQGEAFEGRLVMSYVDPVGALGAEKNLHNDIDVMLTAWNGNEYFPTFANPEKPWCNSYDAITGWVTPSPGTTHPCMPSKEPNHVDNTEQIIVPAPGFYSLTITGYDINPPTFPGEGNSQDFSLAATGGIYMLVNGPNQEFHQAPITQGSAQVSVDVFEEVCGTDACDYEFSHTALAQTTIDVSQGPVNLDSLVQGGVSIDEPGNYRLVTRFNDADGARVYSREVVVTQ